MFASFPRHIAAIATLMFLLACLPHQALADGEVKRTVLKRVDLTGVNGIEVITTLLEAGPGASIPRHTHHGDEFLYVLEGGSIQVPGKDPVTMQAGQVVHFPRGVAHGGFTVVGDTPIKGITTHVVDKGEPLVVPMD